MREITLDPGEAIDASDTRVCAGCGRVPFVYQLLENESPQHICGLTDAWTPARLGTCVLQKQDHAPVPQRSVVAPMAQVL